ncbi:class I SAM-dependent methyltransferase [bacterium]|nr:class I SAM-dependent methyltransferase [bacterium]
MDELSGGAGLYGQLAQYYDKIYSFKSYGDEAARLKETLDAEGVVEGSRILEAACGTGAFLKPLSRWYQCEGFDLAEPMLEVAREKLPDLHLFQADMRDFRVDEPFDALLCLFSSIGYMQNDDDLLGVYASFAAALKPGGLLLMEPWIGPEKFRPGTAHMTTYEDTELKLCRQTVSQLEDKVAVLEMNWLIARAGEGVSHRMETHRMPLVEASHHLELLERNGFKARFEESASMPDRGLIIGKKRP